MLKTSSKTAFALTPLALVVALATGPAQAQNANGNSRIAGLVGNVTQALDIGGERAAARAENAGNRGAGALRSARGEVRERIDSRRSERAERPLAGLAAADRSLRARASKARDEADTPRDPIAVNLNLDTGNLSGNREARGYGVKLSHGTQLYPGSPETEESGFLDKDNETRRTGLESRTSLAVGSPRENDDGERERVSNGLDLGTELSRHGATDRDNGESYNTAELGGFYVQKTVGEDALGGDDVEISRRGAGVKYDSRSGVELDRGNGKD